MKADSEESKAAYEALSKQLRSEYRGHLPVLVERVKRLAGTAKEQRDAAVLGVSAWGSFVLFCACVMCAGLCCF